MRHRRSPLPVRVALLGAIGLALAGCDRRATREECERMLDKYVEMAANADPQMPTLTPPQQDALRAQKREAKRKEPVYEARVAQCMREVTLRQYKCAMASTYVDPWEACLD